MLDLNWQQFDKASNVFPRPASMQGDGLEEFGKGRYASDKYRGYSRE